MEQKKIDELLKELVDSKKDNYDFCDIVALDCAMKRNIHLAEIDSTVADSIETYINFFNRLDEENKIAVEYREPIKIYINSPGGELPATFTIVDTIRMSKTPVWTINTGCAYSGGFLTFISGHKRIAYPNSSFLFHQGSTATWGDANKFTNYADFYKRQLDRIKDITIKYTEITPDEYETHAKDDWWMDVEEGVEYGMVDEVADKLV